MIPGYRAIIDPAAVGLGFEVLVQVTMDREDASTFAHSSAAWPSSPGSATQNGC